MTYDDMDRVVPLGQLDDFRVAEGDPDVRGWEVLASDGRKIGEVDELLVDTSAMKVRYLDVDVDGGVMGGGEDRHVLIPIGYARLEVERDCVLLDGLASSDLAGLPAYGQGPLTRDFETSVRDSFPRRPTPSEGLMAGAGMMDPARLDTPGTGTAMTGMGALSDTGLGEQDRTSGAGVPDGEGMRAAGYDRDSPTASPLSSSGTEVRDTSSPRTGTDSGLGVPDGGGMAASPASGGGPIGGGGGDRLAAGSDYLHDADEDFYASDAFDEGRFYGARRGGGMGDPGTPGGGSGSVSGGASGGLTPGTRGEPGHGTDDIGASREETHRLAQDARELRREDHENRDVDGRGTL